MAAPNWHHLSAFEAVARHGNFSRAAEELNVLQPAISRRVAELETEIGTKLLLRTRPSATLTPDGEILFRAVSGSLLQVGTAIEQIRRQPMQNVLTVNTTIGFASCYLMKRLPQFREANPNVVIELVSRDLNDNYRDEAADVIIVFDHPVRLPGVTQSLIFEETMVPVCRPDLPGAAMLDPSALACQKLLHLTVGIHNNDWQTFFHGTGLEIAPPGSGERFTSFTVYLQAALNGDGIILGWEELLQDHFDLGNLIRVTERRVSTSRGYFACLTARAAEREVAVRFLRWVSGLATEG